MILVKPRIRQSDWELNFSKNWSGTESVWSETSLRKTGQRHVGCRFYRKHNIFTFLVVTRFLNISSVCGFIKYRHKKERTGRRKLKIIWLPLGWIVPTLEIQFHVGKLNTNTLIDSVCNSSCKSSSTYRSGIISIGVRPLYEISFGRRSILQYNYLSDGRIVNSVWVTKISYDFLWETILAELFLIQRSHIKTLKQQLCVKCECYQQYVSAD